MANSHYKASRYNLIIPLGETGQTCIHNTFRQSRVLLDGSESEVSDMLESGAAGSDPALAEALFEGGFLVEPDHDELAQVLEINRLAIADRNRLDVHIMPNMNCNLACTYCYEQHFKSDMTSEVQDRLITWLERELEATKLLLISWFGGEPLLSFDAICSVQDRIGELCREKNVVLVSHMTTNGFNLDSARAQRLIDLGIHSYQITIDGTRSKHNATRPQRGGQGTYDRILTNINTLCKVSTKAAVKLRVNYGPETLSDIELMLQDIEPAVREQVDLVLEPIFGTTPGDEKRASSSLTEMVERAYDCAETLGLKTTKRALKAVKGTYCYADRERQFVVNHTGDVFKCTVSRFEAKDRLARLGENGLEFEDDRWVSWMDLPAQEEKCMSCEFLPLCMGGCRKVRLINGRVSDQCRLPFAGLRDRIAKEVIVQLKGPADDTTSSALETAEG